MGNEERPRVWQTFPAEALVISRDHWDYAESTHIWTYCSGPVSRQIICLVVSKLRLGNDDIV